MQGKPNQDQVPTGNMKNKWAGCLQRLIKFEKPKKIL